VRLSQLCSPFSSALVPRYGVHQCCRDGLRSVGTAAVRGVRAVVKDGQEADAGKGSACRHGRGSPLDVTVCKIEAGAGGVVLPRTLPGGS